MNAFILVPVVHEICQLREGLEYEGVLTIGGVAFRYRVLFTTGVAPINSLIPDEWARVRKLVHVTLKGTGRGKIWLSEEDYLFFVATIGWFAGCFARREAVRAANAASEDRFFCRRNDGQTGLNMRSNHDCFMPESRVDGFRQRFGCKF